MELKIAPLWLASIFAVLMWGIAEIDGPASIASELAGPVSLIVLIIGLATGVSAIVSFRSAATTVNPMKPASSTRLVNTGIYRFSRNPMYLGLLLILFSWAIWLGSAYNLAVLFSFVWYMTKYQILPEEQALEQLFTEDFALYKAKVRRWL